MGSRKPHYPNRHHQSSETLASDDQHPRFREYPIDSPQAAARILALALLADGAIDPAELSALARRSTLQRLGITEQVFDEVIHDLCTDLLIDSRATMFGDFVLGRDALRRILEDIDEPSLQHRLLRGVLDIVHADGELAGGEAVLLSVAAECWDIDPFDSYRILATPGRRWPPQVRRLRRGSW